MQGLIGSAACLQAMQSSTTQVRSTNAYDTMKGVCETATPLPDWELTTLGCRPGIIQPNQNEADVTSWSRTRELVCVWYGWYQKPEREIDLERLLSASHNIQPPMHEGQHT